MLDELKVNKFIQNKKNKLESLRDDKSNTTFSGFN